MNETQKALILSHVQRALHDRRIGIVAEKTGINRQTIAKASKGATNLHASTVAALCNYLGIEIPTE